MSLYFRTQGIVLAKQDRGEADRLFTVFTKDFGKMQLRAVSARKITSKLRGGLELFCCSEIGFVQGKTYKTITDTALLENFSHLRADISSMRVAHRIAEITDELLKGQERDKAIWSLLRETFSFLNRSGVQREERNMAAYYFLWNLLDATGYAPTADKRVSQLLKSQGASLQYVAKKGTKEPLLQEISKAHLLKALGN